MDYIAVLPSRNVEGFDASKGFDKRYVLASILTAEEAFNSNFETDAHFVPYLVFNEDETLHESLPRLNKRGGTLDALRDNGLHVGCLWTAIDWDTGTGEDHLPWDELPEDRLDYMLNVLQSAFENNPLLNQWYNIYVTRKGLRIVYKFKEAILPEEYKGKVGWIINTLHEHGVECDKLTDWCRLFRLPAVVRDNVKTWEEDYCQIIPNGRQINPDDIPDSTIEVFDPSAVVDSYESEIPRGSQITDILHDKDIDRIFRKWLQGREAYDVFFGRKEIPEELHGGRNNALMKVAGSAIGTLYQNYTRFAPEQAYAFMYEAIDKLEDDPDGNDGRSWHDIAWDIILRVYNSERATIEGRRKERAEKQLQLREAYRDRVARQREVLKTSAYRGEDKKGESEGESSPEEVDVEVEDIEDEEDVRQRAILCLNNKFYYIMTPDGGYSPYPVSEQHIAPRIAKTGMDEYLDLTYEEVTSTGDVRERKYTPMQLFERYGTYIRHVQFMPMEGSGYLTNNRSNDERTLCLPLTTRDPDLKPEFNADVDEWLRVLAGTAYEQLCNWIGWALAIEEGTIAALSIHGFPGIGKDLLVCGLSEAFTNKMYASDKDMTGNFNAALLRTCVLWVNEGWPIKSGHKSIADSFREFVTNNVHWVEEKFAPKVKVYNPLRVVMTANNDKMVRRLAQGIQTHSDREAIGVRVFHMEAHQAAKRWLDAKGGQAFTAGWIASPSGKPSDYVVAKHFLWLYEKRHSPGKRLLFEGGLDDELRSAMTYSDNVTFAGTVLVSLLSETIKKPQDGAYLAPDTKEFWVTREGVKKHYLEYLSDLYKDNWHNGYAEGINQYRHAESPRSPVTIKGSRLRWIRIELAEIVNFIESQGLEGAKIDDILDIAEMAGVVESN